jgi:hypothetical protein
MTLTSWSPHRKYYAHVQEFLFPTCHLQKFTHHCHHKPPQTTTLPLPSTNRKTSTKEILLTLSVPKMASSYSLSDQAADLGIHRVHSLVLGDAKKEARMARFSPPQVKRVVLGRGDARYVEHQIQYEQRRELDRIARRNNLKT